MTDHQRDWNEDEISVTELIQSLLRRWKIMVLFTGVVTFLSAVYFLRQPRLYEAAMRLNESVYPILFDAEYPFAGGQHLDLAQSSEFLTQVNKRLVQEGLIDGKQVTADSVISISRMEKEKKGKEDVLLITAQLPASKAALRVLSSWAEEYKKTAPRYRAKRLLHDLQIRLKTELAALALGEDVWEKTGRPALSVATERPVDFVRSYVGTNKTDEIPTDLTALRYDAVFSRELIRGLSPLCESGCRGTEAESSTNSTGVAWQYALCLVQNDRERLFDAPQPVQRRDTTKVKIAVVFLLALAFSAGTVLIVDGTRRKAGTSPDGRGGV